MKLSLELQQTPAETLCRNCKQPIEKFTDPWGKFIEWVHVGYADWSWEGPEDGWVGTNGEKCQDIDENAEPEESQ